MRTVDGLMVCQLCSADNSVVVRRWQCRCPIAGRKLTVYLRLQAVAGDIDFDSALGVARKTRVGFMGR